MVISVSEAGGAHEHGFDEQSACRCVLPPLLAWIAGGSDHPHSLRLDTAFFPASTTAEVAPALASMQTLQSVSVVVGLVGPQNEVAEVLSACCCLRHLVSLKCGALEMNVDDGVAAQEVRDVDAQLCDLTALQELTLSGVWCGPVLVACLKQALQTLRQLRSVVLENCPGPLDASGACLATV